MAAANATHTMACKSMIRRYSGILLVLAITGSLIACGGDGGPTTSAVGSASPNIAVLTWDAVASPNLVGYRVYYGTNSGAYEQGIEAGTETTYTVTGLSGGTTYYFVVTAYDASTESWYSNEVSKDIP